MSDNIKEVLEQYEPPKSENKPESNVQKTTNVRKLINDYQDTVEFNLKEQRKKNLEKSKPLESMFILILINQITQSKRY